MFFSLPVELPSSIRQLQKKDSAKSAAVTWKKGAVEPSFSLQSVYFTISSFYPSAFLITISKPGLHHHQEETSLFLFCTKMLTHLPISKLGVKILFPENLLCTISRFCMAFRQVVPSGLPWLALSTLIVCWPSAFRPNLHYCLQEDMARHYEAPINRTCCSFCFLHS